MARASAWRVRFDGCAANLHDPAVAIVKILRAAEWAAFRASGVFRGSADDRRDGFIHLATRDQLAATLARHFPGEKDVVVVEVAVENDPLLRFEGKGTMLFPHLYRPLRAADVARVAAAAVTP